jgi:hypothetical protein
MEVQQLVEAVGQLSSMEVTAAVGLAVAVVAFLTSPTLNAARQCSVGASDRKTREAVLAIVDSPEI